MYIYMYIYVYMYIYSIYGIYIILWYIYYILYYIYMAFTTERFLEVAIESKPEWDLNPRPLNSIQTL